MGQERGVSENVVSYVKLENTVFLKKFSTFEIYRGYFLTLFCSSQSNVWGMKNGPVTYLKHCQFAEFIDRSLTTLNMLKTIQT